MRVALLLFFLLIISLPAFAGSDSDPIDEINSQMAFVDRVFREFEQQRTERRQDNREEDDKLQKERELEEQKRLQEAVLAEQFADLSGRLSGLPQIPKFEGKFDPGIGKIPEQKEAPRDSDSKQAA